MAVTEPIDDFEVPVFTIGDRLAKAREYRGITQEQIAEQLGRGRTTISAWESGQTQPRDLMGILRRWSEITKVPLGWLLDVPNQNWKLMKAVVSPLELELPFPITRDLAAVAG